MWCSSEELPVLCWLVFVEAVTDVNTKTDESDSTHFLQFASDVKALLEIIIARYFLNWSFALITLPGLKIQSRLWILLYCSPHPLRSTGMR